MNIRKSILSSDGLKFKYRGLFFSQFFGCKELTRRDLKLFLEFVLSLDILNFEIIEIDKIVIVCMIYLLNNN